MRVSPGCETFVAANDTPATLYFAAAFLAAAMLGVGVAILTPAR